MRRIPKTEIDVVCDVPRSENRQSFYWCLLHRPCWFRSRDLCMAGLLTNAFEFGFCFGVLTTADVVGNKTRTIQRMWQTQKRQLKSLFTKRQTSAWRSKFYFLVVLFSLFCFHFVPLFLSLRLFVFVCLCLSFRQSLFEHVRILYKHTLYSIFATFFSLRNEKRK